MRSPISALVWGIWARSRQSILVAVGATVIACLGNLLLPESVRFNADGSPSILIALLNFNLAGPALLLMLSVFSYTEFNPHTNKTGFPYRLFVLPVSSFTLVAVPMLLGAVTAEVFALAWGEAVFGRGDLTPWFLVAMPVYMILYQTIQWTLSRLGPVRLMLLGLLGFMFIVLPIF